MQGPVPDRRDRVLAVNLSLALYWRQRFLGVNVARAVADIEEEIRALPDAEKEAIAGASGGIG